MSQIYICSVYRLTDTRIVALISNFNLEIEKMNNKILHFLITLKLIFKIFLFMITEPISSFEFNTNQQFFYRIEFPKQICCVTISLQFSSLHCNISLSFCSFLYNGVCFDGFRFSVYDSQHFKILLIMSDPACD